VSDDPRSPQPAAVALPRHVAIIMDGNGRWAVSRGSPRVAGHHRGVEAVRRTLGACGERGIGYLTLFAFSSENWRRPAEEVSTLMRLFMLALQREIDRLVELGVRLRVVGEIGAFNAELQRLIQESEQRTAHNDRLNLTICANYGGRWDVAQAAERAAREQLASGRTDIRIDEDAIRRRLALEFAPDPDLLIRTGGERRVSNFLLWQLAYSELYFSEVLWPDFDAAELDAALLWYAGRQRRFGLTGEQVEAEPSIQNAA
jgi:undecaprenyl diphosphate synthase